MTLSVWYPTVQATCRIYNPNTKETTWRSINVSNFTTPPPGLDKRSSRSDQFTITHKTLPKSSDSPSEYAESYTINVNFSSDLQISLDVRRPTSVPGFKIGKGPKGGYSYFGHDLEKPDGYVIHRFWPRAVATGHVIQNGKATSVEGPGMFVHAIQGMRPNLVAARWNFGHFQSEQHGGVSAILMDFTTINDYGGKGAGSGFVNVSVGGLVIANKLVAVTAETKWPGEEQDVNAVVKSRATHLDAAHDPDTGYDEPSRLLFHWAGPSLLPEAPGNVTGTINVDLGGPGKEKGLIEKVDFLAEIPTVVKAVVSYVAGTKPYIYQVCFLVIAYLEILADWLDRVT